MTDTTKTEALRLADAIDPFTRPQAPDHLTVKVAADELRRLSAVEAERDELREHLQFVERWAVHHGTKPHMTAEQALSVIQHYPPISDITKSYSNGKTPDAPNPWAERDRLAAECEALRAKHAPKVEDIDAQDWAGMDAAIAFHLIKRHGEDWDHCGRLMNAWLQANAWLHADATAMGGKE